VLAKQHGVALITAMIITSIAVSIAAMMMYRQQIQIRLSSNINHLEQSYLYANGMEDWAGTILEKSYKDHPEYDSHLDDWYSDSALVLPITGGIMSGKLYDLQARINLNSLIRPKVKISKPPTGSSTGSATVPTNEEKNKTEDKYSDIAAVTRQRLFSLINSIDPDQDMGPPENFAEILKDWIDKDQTNGNLVAEDQSSGNGAESPYYQSLEPAYYSADTVLVSPTELRLLKGMNEKIYKALVENTSTLAIEVNQKSNDTPINVNTTPDQVLKAIGFAPNEVEEINKARQDEPFKTIKDFKALPVVANALMTDENDQEGVDPLDLDVKSSYFLLQGKVEINNTRLFINSILERKNGQVSVIMRDFSNPETITKAID
jgi:general secretion pathway protein K